MHNTSSVLQVNKRTEGDNTTSSAANLMLIWVLLAFSISSRHSPRRAGPSCPRFCSRGVEMVVFSSPECFWQASVLPLGMPTWIAALWARSLPSNSFRSFCSVLWLLMRLESIGCQLLMGVSWGGGWAEANSKGRSFSVHEGAWEDLGRHLGRCLAEYKCESKAHKPWTSFSWAEKHLGKDKELGCTGMGRAKQSKSRSRHLDILVPNSIQDSWELDAWRSFNIRAYAFSKHTNSIIWYTINQAGIPSQQGWGLRNGLFLHCNKHRCCSISVAIDLGLNRSFFYPKLEFRTTFARWSGCFCFGIVVFSGFALGPTPDLGPDSYLVKRLKSLSPKAFSSTFLRDVTATQVADLAACGSEVWFWVG